MRSVPMHVTMMHGPPTVSLMYFPGSSLFAPTHLQVHGADNWHCICILHLRSCGVLLPQVGSPQGEVGQEAACRQCRSEHMDVCLLVYLEIS